VGRILNCCVSGEPLLGLNFRMGTVEMPVNYVAHSPCRMSGSVLPQDAVYVERVFGSDDGGSALTPCIALFLPFRCNKDAQTSATRDTLQKRKSAISIGEIRDPATLRKEPQESGNLPFSACEQTRSWRIIIRASAFVRSVGDNYRIEPLGPVVGSDRFSDENSSPRHQ